MEAGPLGRPQRPRPAKRSGECGHDAVQVAVEGGKSCAVTPSKTNYHDVEEMDSPRDYDEKLAVYGQGFAVHLYSRFMSYVASGSEKRAVLL